MIDSLLVTIASAIDLTVLTVVSDKKELSSDSFRLSYCLWIYTIE